VKIALSAPYAPREIRFLELWAPPGWKIKCYGITHPERCMPDDVVLGAVKELLLSRLPDPDDEEHHGVGFLIVHVAREAVFLLLDLWTGENMLRQHLFTSELDAPTAFRDLGHSRLMACVWEMHVQSHERQAWIDNVLNNPAGPDLPAYLTRRLNKTV
jgi:hypothetical protein